MNKPKPIHIYRGAFGTWFGTRNYVDCGDGVFEAKDRLDIENQADLESLADDAAWWRELREVTSLTPAEIFNSFGIKLKEQA